MNSFPSRANFANLCSSARILHATNGLGAPPKEPKALFDPKKEGALVMKRLDPALEKALNKKGLPIVDVVLDPMLTMRLRDHQKE
jgi:DNA repair and recombination protein RAD54B